MSRGLGGSLGVPLVLGGREGGSPVIFRLPDSEIVDSIINSIYFLIDNIRTSICNEIEQTGILTFEQK